MAPRRTGTSTSWRRAWTGLFPALLLICLAGPARAEAETVQVSESESPGTFQSLVVALGTATFSEKRELVEALTARRFPGTRELLSALLDNRLHYEETAGRILILDKTGDGTVRALDPITGEMVTDYTGDASRVRTNNQLRSQLRGAIARFDLDDPDARVRLAAVRQLRDDLDPAVAALLSERQPLEEDEAVLREIARTIALAQLRAEDATARLAALAALEDEVANDVYNRAMAMIDDDNAEVAEAAQRVIARIDGKRAFYAGLETVFFGLSFGSVLVLAAIGLAITFGVMGVINMAHGELIMLGAYTTYVMQLLLPDHVGLSILLAIPAAFLVSGLVGIAIERGIVRFLYGRPLETLLATFGVSLLLQQLVRSVFSPLNRSVQTPEMMSGLLRVNELFAITWNRLYILIFTLMVFAGLLLILNRTSLGLKVRAVAQNRQMARAMGVRTARVDALTFGLGSGVAGIAGVALSQLTNVGPNLGQAYIIDSFMVVVFGGVGNLWGTLIGGMGLGITNKLLEPHAGAVLAKIMVLVFIILFIQRRKQGLFPQKGRAAEDH